MTKTNFFLLLLIFLILVGGSVWFGLKFHKESPSATAVVPTANTASTNTENTSGNTTIAPLVSPISGGVSRITKKPFGIYVSPTDSPIIPEHFTGYHTGADFETYPSEQTTDVPIATVCTGPLLLKEYASGYGGVAVQGCTINSLSVTIIYGHLRLASITPTVGQVIQAGTQFAVLGTGYSTETDGERKHLHLGIHIGTDINVLGYVANQNDLSGWLDP